MPRVRGIWLAHDTRTWKPTTSAATGTIRAAAGALDADRCLERSRTSGPWKDIPRQGTRYTRAGLGRVAVNAIVPGELGFGRPGKSSTASDIASVTGFALAETTTSDELVALIRHGIENDTSSDRFKTTGGTLEYTDARGYPCVRYQVTTLDTNARVSYFQHASLTLQADSLYCRHPTQPTLGFAISYSHRGPEPDPDFAQRARAFIDGVTVPTADASPAEASEDRP